MVEKVDLPPGMLLAGGRSRRMGGGDKGLLQLGGRSILARVIDRIRPQVSALALNANDDPLRFAAYSLDVVPDPVSGLVGPLAGVLAGMRWARERTPRASHVLTVPADTPFLPTDLVVRLRGALGDPGAGAIATRHGRPHAVVGLWPVDAADALEAAIRHEGMRKVQAWAERLGAETAGFDEPGLDPFFNVNTPEDLESARDLIELDP
jgi:molybdopterin-guanine dinucleotide biosynthesis protein A